MDTLHMVYKFGITTSENKVINIKHKDNQVTIDSFDINIVVRMTSRKASSQKKAIHFGIPSTSGLLKTIKRFLKATNKARVIVDKTRRLFHVNLFMQFSMEEDRFDIHLMDFSLVGCHKGKNKANGVHFENRGKGFGIVHALNL